MKTVGIIAEFNPFHNGHLYLLEYCKKELGAENIVVVMSGDFVQRGTPALVDKFTRTKMALACGADLCLELPVYYSSSSAEYFAQGSVALLDKLGVVDELVFGSECGDITSLTEIAEILSNEPDEFKSSLQENLKQGINFAKARNNALLSVLNREDINSVSDSPNNILGIEYIKALILRKCAIKPVTTKRIGEDYNSCSFNSLSSATAIRNHIFENGISSDLDIAMPSDCIKLLKENSDRIYDYNLFSKLLFYKLIQAKKNGFSNYLDITDDFSNKIISNIEKYEDFDSFCGLLKSKDIAYSRVSRNLIHIFLDIFSDNMAEYKANDYTSFIRVLGMKKAAFPLLKEIKENSTLPVITNLKQADSLLDVHSKHLLDETLSASEIYNILCSCPVQNEYRRKPIII